MFVHARIHLLPIRQIPSHPSLVYFLISLCLSTLNTQMTIVNPKEVPIPPVPSFLLLFTEIFTRSQRLDYTPKCQFHCFKILPSWVFWACLAMSVGCMNLYPCVPECYLVNLSVPVSVSVCVCSGFYWTVQEAIKKMDRLQKKCNGGL